MYKIGELSKIVDIPIKTLRYYDECGVLKAVSIDNFTGYRYYDDDSVVECELIKMLKALNFTLDEIKEYKENFCEDILLNKQKEIAEEIQFLKKKYDKLSSMIRKDEIAVSTVKVYEKLEETKEEKVLRRKYERRDIRKYL